MTESPKLPLQHHRTVFTLDCYHNSGPYLWLADIHEDSDERCAKLG